MKVYHCFILLLILTPLFALAQSDTTGLSKPEFSITGFMDVYYGFDFSKPSTNERLPFIYNHNRHHEFNLNLGLVKVAVSHQHYRATLAIQAGTYAIDNYAQEPEGFRHVYEANAGVALNQHSTVWLDAGIFPSHIGFESAISSDNWTLTRSLLAENSPYYLAGAKLSVAASTSLSITAIICNGWQRIQRVPGNSLPGLGTQVYYESGNFIFNWSTFSGTDDPDSTRRLRFFNNFFSRLNLSAKTRLTLGFDMGIQQQEKGSHNYNAWYSPVAILSYKHSPAWAYAARVEYYADPQEVIIATGTPNGFRTLGFSVNADFVPTPNVLLRMETRWFNSHDKIFEEANRTVSDNICLMASLAVTF